MTKFESILVFGATGACGRAVVRRALHRGLRVTAFVRNEDKARELFGVDVPNLEFAVGGIADRGRIHELLDEHDAVISCLSSFEPPHNSMSVLTESLVTHTEKNNGQKLRFITYSLCGVEKDGDRVSHSIQNALRWLSPGKFGPAIQDHKAVAKMLGSSTLDYTLFQTATMTDKAQGCRYRSGSPESCPGVRLWDRWGVLDAADVCLDSLDSSGLKRLQMRYLPS